MGWEKIFAKHKHDKDLLSKVYKKFNSTVRNLLMGEAYT